MIETTSSARHIAQLWPIAEENSRRELGKERVRQIEVNIETFQPWKHVDLHLREDLTAIRLQGMWQGRIRKDAALPLFPLGPRLPICCHVMPPCSRAVGPNGKGFPRDIFACGSSLGSRIYRVSRSLRCAAITFGLFAISFFMISSGFWFGRSAFNGSRAKSKPDTFPSLGCVLNTGDAGSALLGSKMSDWSWALFCCQVDLSSRIEAAELQQLRPVAGGPRGFAPKRLGLRIRRKFLR